MQPTVDPRSVRLRGQRTALGQIDEPSLRTVLMKIANDQLLGHASQWYGESMTVAKVTVSLDPAIAARARRDVEEGRAKSVSAWLNEAARERAESDDLASVLAELFNETGGPLTEQELARARQRIASAEQR